MIQLSKHVEIENTNTLNTNNWEFLKQIDLQNELIKKIDEYKNNNFINFNQIVLIGIGGSMLGPQAIYKVLEHQINPNIEVLFIDNLDGYEIKKVESKLNWKSTLFITITKSGNTPETMGAFYYFKEQAQKRELDLSKNFLFICDEGENNLRLESEKVNAISFDIPKNLGGRYSVLSSVGLVFSALLDLDIKKLVSGGKMAKEEFLNKSDKKNSALNIALQATDAYNKGQNIFTLFPYFKRGEFLGKWFIQLFAESLGKIRQSDGKIFSPTPIYAIGATDQHSIVQLFKEGANDKFYIFLELKEDESENIYIPAIENEKLSYLSNHSFSKVLNTELQATIDSLVESGRNICKLQIDKLNEESLGYLFIFFEIICACIGDSFQINTFDQPGVERSKVLTKEYLENSKG